MRTCEFNNCPNDHYAKDLCRMHYKRFKTHGDPNITAEWRKTVTEESTSRKWLKNRWREETEAMLELVEGSQT